jgi:hypothetical protein
MRTVEADAPVKHRLYWWKELLIIAVFYGIYSVTRNQFGSANMGPGEPVHAFNNALRVIRVERFVGLFHEQAIQSWFTGWHSFLWFWNVYYGTFHFAVTIGAFIWMFVRSQDRFARWRNTLAFTTVFAIVGFSLFPLMPPRLLDDPGRYGGERIALERHIESFGFEDTLKTDGGLWSFDSGAMQKISNQYAAMPSLHCAWATWCTLAMWPLVKRRRAKALLVAYPILTLFCIIVTANHYWLDGIGGLVILAAGMFAGHELDRWNQRRLGRLPTRSSRSSALSS